MTNNTTKKLLCCGVCRWTDGGWFPFVVARWFCIICDGASHQFTRDSNPFRGVDRYHLNAEHAESDANVELVGARDVRVYGLKSEGQYCVLWMRDSQDVQLRLGWWVGGGGSSYRLRWRQWLVGWLVGWLVD